MYSRTDMASIAMLATEAEAIVAFYRAKSAEPLPAGLTADC
jgi:hypothetical protein